MAKTHEEHIEHDPLAPPVPVEHPEEHEHSDVSIKALVVFFVIFIGVAVIVHLGLWALFAIYEHREAQADIARRQSALVVEDQGPRPGVPRLQGIPGYHTPTPAMDTMQMQAENYLKLNGDTVRTEDGRIRIAIGEAMDLIIEHNMLAGPDSGAAGQGGQSNVPTSP